MKLLLHTCCGPCFLGVWEDLGKKDLEVTGYFYNPNIQPDEEYAKRLDNLKKASRDKMTDLLVPEYFPERHLEKVSEQKDDFPRRCLDCYRLRLEDTAKEAKAGSFDSFSTTLLVSPYQQHDKLKEIGEEMADKYGIGFYYTDWRPYFREGQQTAREMEVYRQKYCGCIYSLEESRK
jgi:epoxyqueuosine reductase